MLLKETKAIEIVLRLYVRECSDIPITNTTNRNVHFQINMPICFLKLAME